MSSTRWVILIAAASGAVPADASNGNGSIACRIIDERGRALDGTCHAAQGAARLSCVTRLGRCTIADVPPGEWNVTVAPVGGSPLPARSVQVAPGSSTAVSMRVTLGSAGADAGSDGATAAVVGATSAVVLSPASSGDAAVRSDAADAPAGRPDVPGADAGVIRTSLFGVVGIPAPTDAGSRPAADRSTSGVPDVGGAAGDAGTTSGSSGPATVAPPPDGSGGGAAVPDAGAPAADVTIVGPGLVGLMSAQPPDRSSGTRLAVEGRAVDSRGRAIDGSVVVTRGGVAVGRAATAVGRYRLYDLPTGTLVLEFRPLAGAPATRTIEYSGAALTVNFRIEGIGSP